MNQGDEKQPMGNRYQTVMVSIEYCHWCEEPISPKVEEFMIRRYLAVGGWADIGYHMKCAASHIKHLEILDAVFSDLK